MASATAGSGSVDQASSSAVPPSTSRPGCGKKYAIAPSAPVETIHVSIPGFSTTTSCPRTGRTDGSGTSSRAASPVQLTTTGASRLRQARHRTSLDHTPRCQQPLPQPRQMGRHVDERQPCPHPRPGGYPRPSPSAAPAAARRPTRRPRPGGLAQYSFDHPYPVASGRAASSS